MRFYKGKYKHFKTLCIMLLKDYVGKWWNLFDKQILIQTLNNLGKLYETQSILPKQSDVFRAFHECNYNDCKVVIIGQD